MCAQRRLKSACVSAQSDQSLCCQHEEILHRGLSKIFPVNILVNAAEEGTETSMRPALKPWSCWTKFCYVFGNSSDPDQLASEANWSGFALFVIKYVNSY